MSARPPHVTITLGLSGQVVKKERSNPDNSHTDYVPSSGSKRPIRERLGNNVDDHHSYGSQYEHKRQRRDYRSWSPSDDDPEDEKQQMPSHRVGRDDLRFKLIHKSLSKRSRTTDPNERNGDLREKLSRNSHGPYDERHVPESRSSHLSKRIPPTRSAEDLRHLETLRKPYPLTAGRPRHRSPDRLSGVLRGRPRHRSPDRLSGVLRGMSPPRTYDNLRQVPSLRSIEVVRPTSFLPRSVIGASRAEPLARKATIPAETAKPVMRPPISSANLQKTSYMTEEPHTVAGLLQSLGLGKYAITFQAEEVDMTALKQMGDNDLKELGIPMGPRKKILLAVLPHPRQRHS